MGKKISIVGWYGQNNLGDEAFRAVFEQQWGTRHELHFGQTPDLSCDLIVYGGGGVVGGDYLDNLPRDRTAVAVGVDIPLNGSSYERLREYRFEKIYTRSKEYAHIGKYKLGMENLEYCPDLVFALDAPTGDHFMSVADLLRAAGNVDTKCLLGVNVSIDLPTQCYENMASALDEMSKRYTIVLFSVYEGLPGADSTSDRRVATSIAELMKVKPLILGSLSGNPHLAIALTGFFTRMISMRFHGCIFAAVASRTFLALARRGKHSLFCEQSGLSGYFVDLADFTSYKLTQALDFCNTSQPILSVQRTVNAELVRQALQNIEGTYLK